MIREEAISKMIAPGQRRKGKWRDGVIQIHITRACDRACYSCTQASNLLLKPDFITLENFEIAVKSLVGYFGVVGMFGGNPALHPDFPELCNILAKYIPREQRGLWCNNPMKHGKLMSTIFNPKHSNLNVHQSQEAYNAFKRDWPECKPCGLNEDSRHSPVYASMIDMDVPESQRWELISKCDINHHWSAMIGQFRGQPRAWFCEIAGGQAMLMQNDPEYPDTGIYPDQGWYRKPLIDFANQIDQHCHNCAVPLKGRGQLANSTTDKEQTTKYYLPVFKPKHNREVEVVESADQLGTPLGLMTDYIGNSKK